MIIEITTSGETPPFGRLHVRTDAGAAAVPIEFVGWMGLLRALTEVLPQPDLALEDGAVEPVGVGSSGGQAVQSGASERDRLDEAGEEIET